MDRYDKLAEVIREKIAESKSDQISITVQDALDIYNALLGMSRIGRITKSEYGGSELFR